MHSDLDILGVLNALVLGIYFPARKRVACDPIKYPPFPPAVKSMPGTQERFDVSALIITGVSTGERR